MNIANTIVRASIPAVVALIFALSRRFLPARNSVAFTPEEARSFRSLQWTLAPATVVIGLALGLSSYGLLLGANHALAFRTRGSFFTLLPSRWMWCFSPGLIALGLSYELTLRLWTFIEHSPRPRKFESWTSSTAGFDTLRALRILVLTLGIPGLIVTLLALPIHTCITNTGLSIGHFAHITMVEHPYSDVRNITVTLGIRLRNGSLERWPAIVLDFQDGTRWSSGDNRDPEPAINEQLLQFLVAKTGLTPRYIDAFPFGKA